MLIRLCFGVSCVGTSPGKDFGAYKKYWYLHYKSLVHLVTKSTLALVNHPWRELSWIGVESAHIKRTGWSSAFQRYQNYWNRSSSLDKILKTKVGVQDVILHPPTLARSCTSSLRMVGANNKNLIDCVFIGSLVVVSNRIQEGRN